MTSSRLASATAYAPILYPDWLPRLVSANPGKRKLYDQVRDIIPIGYPCTVPARPSVAKLLSVTS
eukprot:9276704-Pyramimonas_sp.AAC.1